MVDGKSRRAVINGVAFAAGETRNVRCATGSVRVRCREIRRNEVVAGSGRIAGPVTLKNGEEKLVP